jgi:hypothetical protein
MEICPAVLGSGVVQVQALSPALVLVAGLSVALLIIVVAVAIVAIVSVASKNGSRRKDGIRVLRELGRMLTAVLGAIRAFWNSDHDKPER